jgi:DNA-binding response OmpR family regulator
MKSCVLLAAHETEILRSLPLILQEAGHRVQIAASGLQALNQARRCLPSLIILDATLPDMDGSTACEILSLLPSTTAVPRILLAARTVVFSEVTASPGQPGDDAIPPFNSEEIVRRVKQVLGQKTEAREEAADQDAA